ncbi:MAG: SLATT domain-containing protein [Solirubrobacteraceae bacterium]
MSEEEIIAAEAKRIESDALYTGQANFRQAVIFGRLHTLLGLPAVLLAALAGTAIIAAWSNTLAGACAIGATVFASADLFISSERRAAEHSSQGVEYRQLQHEARRLRTLAPFSEPLESRRTRLQDLLRRQTDLNRLNRPSEWAFQYARRKIESGEVLQPGDEELK